MLEFFCVNIAINPFIAASHAPKRLRAQPSRSTTVKTQCRIHKVRLKTDWACISRTKNVNIGYAIHDDVISSGICSAVYEVYIKSFSFSIIKSISVCFFHEKHWIEAECFILNRFKVSTLDFKLSEYKTILKVICFQFNSYYFLLTIS